VRLALLALLFCAAACERDHGPAQAGNPKQDPAREQTTFDKERNPRKVVEALKIGPGSRVADIGAGSGLLTIHLARAVAPNGRVVATDIDVQVLDLLHQRLQAAGLADIVERRIVDPDKPDLEPGIYDAILLAEVDHQLRDAVGWLAAAIPALKPSGRIVISNRVYYRAGSLAGAQKAGLVLESESAPVPSHFIAVFVPARSK
jgi:arsenite methyltransferase